MQKLKSFSDDAFSCLASYQFPYRRLSDAASRRQDLWLQGAKHCTIRPMGNLHIFMLSRAKLAHRPTPCLSPAHHND